jgi:hypothetical protein
MRQPNGGAGDLLQLELRLMHHALGLVHVLLALDHLLLLRTLDILESCGGFGVGVGRRGLVSVVLQNHGLVNLEPLDVRLVPRKCDIDLVLVLVVAFFACSSAMACSFVASDRRVSRRVLSWSAGHAFLKLK